MAVEAAMEAGPVQTSLAGVYDGTDDDDVGLDMEEEDDVTSMGSVASWVTSTRATLRGHRGCAAARSCPLRTCAGRRWRLCLLSAQSYKTTPKTLNASANT